MRSNFLCPQGQQFIVIAIYVYAFTCAHSFTVWGGLLSCGVVSPFLLTLALLLLPLFILILVLLLFFLFYYYYHYYYYYYYYYYYRDILALPVRLGGLGMANPCHEAAREHASSIKVTSPLVEQIMNQSHQLPEDSLVNSLHQATKAEKSKELTDTAEGLKNIAPRKTQRALKLAQEKGSSLWLTVLPLQELGFDLNKREFRDAVKLRYDWPFDDIPSVCVCGETFTVDHAMICKRGGFVIQRHNELRDLEADLLNMVCSDVEVEPVLQDISGEQLNRGSNKAQDARLDIHARGFWGPQSSAFFATLMPSLIGTRKYSRSTASMKMTRSDCIQGECWMSNTAHSRHLYLQRQEGWGTSAIDIIVDWLN